MINKTSKKERNKKRHFRLRKKIIGTQERPRLSIFKSNKHIYAQIIDDINARTLLSYSTLHPEVKKELKTTWTKEAAKLIGEKIAKSADNAGIKNVVFDRGGSKYHGKILAFAEAARNEGLEF
ncbi:MAG: 50S ribosomal protein L18 [Candidatus Melainabacteria bacterium]|nr:50S ribosomal protein L18 [Candidatus Melainabacteria bacterium]